MKCSENKTCLIDLICEVTSMDYTKALKMLKCKEIYLSKEDGCFLFNKNSFHSATHLKSNQEEADSKVILHFLDALKEPETTVVLRSSTGDTDIVVLAVSLISSSQDQVFTDYGNGKNLKAIKLSNANMATDLKQALAGFHAFTGNDYVSSFFTKGKIASWKKMVKDEKYIQGFQEFGMSWEIMQEIFEVLQEFVCKMHGFNCASVNKVRSNMFTKRLKQGKKSPDLSLLPPCQSVLKYHMQQAIYVAKLWRSSYIPSIDAPQFTEFDLDSEGNPIWVDGIFPENVKELLMLDPDAKSCDEDESNQYQEMDKNEDDFEEESDDYDTEDDEEKDSDVFQDLKLYSPLPDNRVGSKR